MTLEHTTSQGVIVVLHGLQGDPDLEAYRKAMAKGTIKPFSNRKAMEYLKKVAKGLHEQMRLIPDFHQRVRTGESPLGWFLTAVHRIIPPSDSRTNSQSGNGNNPFEFLSSMPPWHKDIDFGVPEALFESELPPLDSKDMLPLAYWGGVWYAIVAEIKVLYADLEKHYGQRFEHGDVVLHHKNALGTDDVPITAWDFALILEESWDVVTNPLLTTTLDFAVMQHAAFLSKGDIPTFSEVLAAEGLYSITFYNPPQIMRLLAEHFAQQVKIAVRTRVSEIAGMLDASAALDAHRAELKEIAEENGESNATVEDDQALSLVVPQVAATQAHQLLTNTSLSQLDSESQHDSPDKGISRGRLAQASTNLAYIGARSVASTNPFRDHSSQRYPEETMFRSDATTLAQQAPAANYFCSTTPSRQPLPASSRSFPSSHHQAVNQSFSSSASGEAQKFPSFDDSRPLPPPPHQAGSLEQDEDNFPTLRRMGTGTRAVTSSNAALPERMAANRSYTAPTGPAPFAEKPESVISIPRSQPEQRYVPAGGDTPLHERQIMQDFLIPFEDQQQEATFTANKDELFAQIDASEQLQHMARVESARKAASSVTSRGSGGFRSLFSYRRKNTE